MAIIPEKIKTRIFPNGKLCMQLSAIKLLTKEYPDSEYAKNVNNKLRLKFWFGSNRIRYKDIFNEAWSLIINDPSCEIIEIGRFKFLNDDLFRVEYTDIFICGQALDFQNMSIEKIVAYRVLSVLCSEGPYENDFVKLFKDDTVIDAGANLGLFSLFSIQKGAKRVYAFEPQKKVLEMLKKNITLNNLEKLVTILPLGLSDKNADFYLSHSNNCHATSSVVIKRTDDNDNELIHCITLDK